MAVRAGDDILISHNGTTVKATVTHSLDLSVDMIETTTKDSNRAKEYIPGHKDATISVEGKYDDAASSENFSDLFADWNNGDLVTVVYGLQSTGNSAYSCDAYISSMNLSGEMNAESTFSFELQVTGGVTEVTLT